jgi:NAD(P)-dependent dehydrogenase (short-subunit alcohol dehydrogenase family)
LTTVLITGCDTGIGREFATQCADAGRRVIATYRDMANRLPDHSAIRHFPLDVTSDEQFRALKRELGDEPIDLLVSNAGIGLDIGQLGRLDFSFVQQMIDVNTIGPLRLVETFIDNVAASTERRIAVVSSRMGSIGLNLSGGHYGYRASKAGLNAIIRSLAIDLFPRGVTVVILHPGWVNTAGGAAGAQVPVAESVAGMLKVISRLGNHETGQFFSFTGQPLAL